jgi:heavy metal translocating P-type ATPase
MHAGRLIGVTTTQPNPAAPDSVDRAPDPSVLRAAVRSSAWRLPEVTWAAIATVLFAAGGIAQLGGAPSLMWWALYLACYVTGGWEPGLAGLRALKDKTLDVDLLMVAAAIGAASIGQVFDGALLIVIFATSGALEAVATHRTEESVRSLLDLAPQTATRLFPDGGEQTIAAEHLIVGDVILVRPGERIGADGEVIDGASEADQASITGEPMPVNKLPGDEVFAGTLNGSGALTVRVNRAAADTVIARIVAMVAQASATKSRAHLFIEKVEQRYSIGMVAATLALFAIPLLFGADVQSTLLRAMTFMIVASPCAVVLATMPPLLAAIANAGRHGVLVKSAVVMEQLADADLVAFDKTGTLTEGAPRVAAVEAVPSSPLTGTDVLRFAAAAEHQSEHPLAAAIVAAARHHDLQLPPAQGFTSAPGRGVTATAEGHTIEVGSPALLGKTAESAAGQLIGRIQHHGHTAAVVIIDGRPAGVIGLADRIRPAAAPTVAALIRLTGHTPVLLTGDNPGAATALAAQAGITQVHAGLLPNGKARHVQALQQQGRKVILVGDGVNDAPAMATADLGIAMGCNGSDLALQTADAVIVRDELATLPAVLNLARRARRVVIANLAIAATFITVLVIWDLAGHLPLPLGVAGHEGSTVIVGLNGLRLLRKAAWRKAARP